MIISLWRERWRQSPRLQDNLTAAATFAVGLALNVIGLTGVYGDLDVDQPEWWHTALLAAGCAAMLIKRRRPVVALSAGTVAAVADALMGGSVAMILVLFDLLFAAGQFASARARAAVTTAVIVTIGTLSVVIGLAAGDARATVLIGLQLAGLLVVPLWWAANLRQQRELGELMAERARHEAVHAERSAMARELHDVIASHLSTTAIHSGAALSLPADAARDREALREVRASSLAALEEMRTMIMLLRADAAGLPTEVAVPAGLEQLDDLVEATRAAGHQVTVSVPAGLRVPPLADHAAYRIVHEALTNARKHAPGSRIHVEVRPSGDDVRVIVSNSAGPFGKPDTAALSTGTGLHSMRERATLVGGRLHAGPDGGGARWRTGPHGGGWRVEASLPLHPPAANEVVPS